MKELKINFLSDVITYVRRIVKTPSNAVLTDTLIIDYINRFMTMDMDARLQLFDFKTKYQFQTSPGVDRYNMPLYNFQLNNTVGMYPVYQGFLSPAYINGVQVYLETLQTNFQSMYPNYVQNFNALATGTGISGPYTLTLPILGVNSVPNPPNPPLQSILRGHVDLSGIIATGVNQDPPFGSTINLNIPSTSIYPAVYITTMDANGNSVVVQDSGQFLNDGSNKPNYGLLMAPGNAPDGYTSLGTYSTTQNTVNYLTGVINVNFPVVIPQGQNINVQVYYFQTGLPRGILYYNNTLTLRSPPDRQYLVELDAYLTPAVFLNSTKAIPFAYMSEYIARGAARKLLSDTGDVEQFNFYEPLFREQELLVWKRSQRQWTNNRTPTIYSNGGGGNGTFNYGGYAGWL